LYDAVSISYLPASAGFLLGVFLCPANEGDMFPRNVELHNPEDTPARNHHCDNLRPKIIYFIDQFSVMSPKIPRFANKESDHLLKHILSY
jgi:hypothetical protein